MAMRLSLLAVILMAGPAWADAARWEAVNLDDEPTTMALTEDGKTLVVAHEKANRLSVYDVKSGKLQTAFDCPAPRHVLCRGEWVFAACVEKGTIRQFTLKDGKLVKDVAAGKAPHYISAPWGKAFAGKVLVTCMGPKGAHPYLVDMTAGTATAADSGMSGSHRNAEFLPDGKGVRLGAGTYGLEVFGGKAKAANLIDDGISFALGQTGAWFGPGGVRCPEDKRFRLQASVAPFNFNAGGQNRTMVFPDAVGGHFGVVDDTVLRFIAAADGTGVAAVPIQIPQWLVDACKASGSSENGYCRTLDDATRVYYPPCSVTLEGVCYAFMMSSPRLAEPPRQDKPVLYRLEAPFKPAKNGMDGFVPLEPGETERVTGLSLTEDGENLVLSHEKANKLSVIDVKTSKLVATVTVPDPRFILCRGGKLYVASYDSGNIIVVDPANWKTAGSFKAGARNITWMGAPPGKAFEGKIAIAFSSNASVLLDVATGNLSQGNSEPARYESPACERMRFAGNSFFWSGKPAEQSVRSGLGVLLVPDLSAPLVYSISPWRISCHRADGQLSIIAERGIQTPAAINMHRDSGKGYSSFEWLSTFGGREKTPVPLPPQAVTLDGKLYLFVVDPHREGKVLRCMAESFSTAGTVAALPSPGDTLAAVPATAPASDFAITEDGQHLVVGHATAGRLSVWNIASGKFVRTLAVPAPGPMLCRGGRVFVHSSDDGTVSVFDTKDWSLRDNIKVGAANVRALSAAGGANFKGKLLAITRHDPNKPSSRSDVYLVDVEKDSSQKLVIDADVSYAVVDYTGRHVLVNSWCTATWDDFIAGKQLKADGKTSIPDRLYQVANERFWFGRTSIWTGTPPQPLSATGRRQVMPDVLGQCFATIEYTGNSQTRQITIRRLDAEMAVLGSAKIMMPDVEFREGVCVAMDKTVHVFVTDRDSGVVRFAQVKIESRSSPGVGGEAGEFAVKDGQFPAKVLASKALAFKLPGAGAGVEFELARGPEGATVTKDGTIRWTPARGQAGEQEFKIRIQRGKDVTFERYTTHVATGDVAATGPAGGKPIFVLGDDCRFIAGGDGKSILVLAGQELIVLNADGMQRSRADLPHACKTLVDCGKTYAVFSEKTVLLLDKQTLRVSDSVKLDHAIVDLAGHPGGPVIYAAVTDGSTKDLVARHRVMVIDLASKKVEFLPRVYGQHLAMDATGNYLYVALHVMYKSGYVVDWDFDYVGPAYDSVELLTCHDLGGKSPVFASANFGLGGASTSLVASPDGQELLCAGSSPSALPLLHAADVSKTRLSIKTGSSVTSAAFHPRLPLAAVAVGGKLKVFRRTDGGEESSRCETAAFSSVKSVCFTPDGQAVIAAGVGADGRTMIAALRLKIDAGESAVIAKAPAKPVPATMPLDTSAAAPPEKIAVVPAGKLGTLSRPALKATLKPKEIGRQYNDAVVVVQTPTSSGTGFFVGDEGYIITSAHVLSALGEPTVKYRCMENGKVVTGKARARIVRVDEANDLALLRVAIRARPPVVTLTSTKNLEAGEEVVVIGHPGLGQETLDYTLTTGVVSNPRQVVDKRQYVQTNAAANPGSSGSPVFDSHGNVIGMVLLKGKIEGASFATPSDQLRTFLESCTRQAGK